MTEPRQTPFRSAATRTIAALSATLLTALLIAAALACASETVVETVVVERDVMVEIARPVPVVETVIVERDVLVEVEREVTVVREVEVPVVQTVIREIEVEVLVPQTVVVEREIVVEKEVQVPVEVIVEKEVLVEREVTVLVEKEVVVVQEQKAEATASPGSEQPTATATLAAPTATRTVATPSATRTVVEPTAKPTVTTITVPKSTVTSRSETFSGSIDGKDDVDEYSIVQNGTGPVEVSTADIPLAPAGASANRLYVCPSWTRGCTQFYDGTRVVWRQINQGTYIIRVKNVSGDNTFPYSIQLVTTKDDFAEVSGVAHQLESGQSYSDSILPDGDVDYYSIVQNSTGPVEVSTADIPLAPAGASANRLYVCPSWTRGCTDFYDGTRVVWRQVPRGSYTVKVYSPSEYKHFPYSIRLITDKDDFAEVSGVAHQLESGQSYSDSILPDGDVDYYSIVQNSTGPVEVSTADIPLAPAGASANRLYVCPSWTRGCTDFYDGTRVVWRQVPRGSYTVKVYSPSEYKHFPYSIRLITDKDDFAEVSGVAHQLESGQSYSDSILPDGDVDYYSIVQNSTGPVEVSTADIPLAPAGASANRLYVCPSWTRGCTDFYDGTRVVWRQVPRGSYTVKVYSPSEYKHFPYSIRLITDKDDFAEVSGVAHQLESGQSYSDSILPDGDVDYYSIVQNSTGPVEVSTADIPLAPAGASANRLYVCPSWTRGCTDFYDGTRNVWDNVPRGRYTLKVYSPSEYNNFPYSITVKFNAP